jgi:hypothetical protein
MFFFTLQGEKEHTEMKSTRAITAGKSGLLHKSYISVLPSSLG